MSAEFHTDDAPLPTSGLYFCLVEENFQSNFIRSTTKIWVLCIVSMEFLRLFFKRHFARKPRSGGVVKCQLFLQAVTKVTSFSFWLQERFIGRFTPYYWDSAYESGGDARRLT